MTFNPTEYHSNYRKEKLKRVSLDIPKEEYEQIKEHAEKHSEKPITFIKRAIREAMENDK